MKTVLTGLIRSYQLLISPLLPAACRYQPTCSAYALTAVQRFGALRGTWMALRRISRCHPWHPGGYDPVPPWPTVGKTCLEDVVADSKDGVK